MGMDMDMGDMRGGKGRRVETKREEREREGGGV
jgi:hypothetical protein